MFNYYDIDILPLILKRFKVNDIIVTGELDEKTLKILNDNYGTIHYLSNQFHEDSNNYSLNILHNFNNYDAIFINDDPNWYTVYNELRIIKETNAEFPIVFICNNIFPHKRRDSYFHPEIIPKEFRNDYIEKLVYGNVNLFDGLYHAINENTSKNGVLTAIEDFLSVNQSISMMDINLINGITILYPNNSISQIRLNLLKEDLINYDFEYDGLIDNFVENQFLREQLSQLETLYVDKNEILKYESELEEKDKIVEDYEDKIKLHDNEISYKNSQINNVNSKLSLREAQIKNFELKLANSEDNISDLNSQLQSANNLINSLKSKINQDEKYYKDNELNLNNKISEANSLINSLKSDLSKKEQVESNLNKELQVAKLLINENNEQLNNNDAKISKIQNLIKTNQSELKNVKNTLKSIKQQYFAQASKLDNKEYCIICYKDEIKNNNIEIEYLKNENLLKKILNPVAYLILITKSNPNQLILNLKLYKSLKNSKCFDIGFYLNNNNDLIKSKWCKYFSPELHYICYGFNEKRKFNKKYFNRNSKEELLDYILKCQ